METGYGERHLQKRLCFVQSSSQPERSRLSFLKIALSPTTTMDFHICLCWKKPRRNQNGVLKRTRCFLPFFVASMSKTDFFFFSRGEIGGTGAKFQPSFFPFLIILLPYWSLFPAPSDATVATSGERRVVGERLLTRDCAADPVLMDVCVRLSPANQHRSTFPLHGTHDKDTIHQFHCLFSTICRFFTHFLY